MPVMQAPTCTDVRIRSTHDAHKIFMAVQRGELFMVNRRLDADERLALRSGCVYAWEERGPHTEITGLGIERFTEGRRWSPSRVRDEFLFYYEKYSPPQDGSQSSNSSSKQPPRDWDPLVKQTYSVWVDTDKGRRKWHLTAYFTQATVDQLGTVDDIPGVADLVVPSGLFQSTRVGKNRKVDDSQGRNNNDLKPAMTSSLTRAYVPFTTATPHRGSRSPVKSGSPKLYEPYQIVSHNHGSSVYSDAQIPQYSASPPTIMSHVPLPPLRDLHQPCFDARRHSIPATPQHFPEYGRHDIYGRSSISENLVSRTENSPYRAPQGEDDMKSTTFNSRLPHSSLHSHRVQVDSTYLPVSETAANSPEHTLSSHPSVTWYPHQSSHESNLDHQSIGFPLRNDMASSYHAAYSQLLGPAPSSTAHQATYAQPELLSYTSHHAVPNMQSQSYTHPQPHSHINPRLRSASHNSRASSSPISNPQLPSDQSYFSPYESHSADPCGFENESRRGSIGPSRGVDLAPLHALQRSHPYRRDPVDDRALRLLGPRSS